MNTTTAKIKKELEEEIIASVSTGRKEIKKLLTIDKVIAQIDNLRLLNHGVKIPATPTRNNSTHIDYVDFLIKWRRKAFAKNKALKQSITESIQHKFKAREVATKEEREQLLKHQFYSLSGHVLENERYTERKDVAKNPVFVED